MTTIAWIGLGQMGLPMSRNLAAAPGNTVRGFDLNPQAVEAAARNGLVPAASIADAVRGADVVFTMLPKGDHVRSVYFGHDGVLSHAAPGTLLIDSSTIDVAAARQLHTAAATEGFRMVDAPVSGGISGADAGTLAFMIGGSPEDTEAARAVIEPMAGNIIAAGGDGAGQAAKICNNMMLFIALEAAAEGSVLAARLGLDAETFWEIARVSSGDSWAVRTWYPVPGVVPTAAANNGFESTFKATLALKDAGLALMAADDAGIELPAAALVAERLQRLVDEGLGDKDCSLITKYCTPDGVIPGWQPAGV